MTREEAIKNIKEHCYFANLIPQAKDALDMAIKALEQEVVLDKIRAEIKQLTSRYTVSKERGGMGQVEWSDRLIKEDDILNIIDKYKTESEG